MKTQEAILEMIGARQRHIERLKDELEDIRDDVEANAFRLESVDFQEFLDKFNRIEHLIYTEQEVIDALYWAMQD